MKNSASIKLVQPLRERHKARTRERILQAVAARLEQDGLAHLSFAQIAEAAEVGESTVYRYFANKETLLAAFWEWAPGAIGMDRFPQTFAELAGRLPSDFASFDRQEALIRGMLASPLGKASRLQANAAQQKAFRDLVDREAGPLPKRKRDWTSAAIQLLYSATTWGAYRDLWGMSGEQAGQAAVYAIGQLLESARRERDAQGAKGAEAAASAPAGKAAPRAARKKPKSAS